MKSLKALLLIVFIHMIFLNTLPATAEQTRGPLITMFNKIAAEDKNQNIPRRVYKKFTPYKVIVSNSGQNEAEFSYNNTAALLPNGTEEYPAGEKDVFNSTKVPVLKRALIVGIPVTALSLGFLTIPVVGTLYALDVDANNTYKKQLSALYFDKAVLKPSEEKTYYILLPKKSSDVKDIYIKQN